MTNKKEMNLEEMEKVNGGGVKVRSPVNVSGGKNNTYNMNF